MSSVGDVMSREERPPLVRFERRPVENVAESVKQGRYVATDVDFALVTPPYSKDCIVHKVSSWLEIVKKNVRDGRTPQSWLDQWKELYRRWQNGQEMPLNGTPIKGWGVISPAQQEMLININCMTVEDLAVVNDEGIRRIGIGAMELKNKAVAWLASMKDHGAVTQKMAALEHENTTLKTSLDTLQRQVEMLKAMIPQQHAEVVVQRAPSEITADELLDGNVPLVTSYMRGTSEPVAQEPPKRRGRPPKQVEAPPAVPQQAEGPII